MLTFLLKRLMGGVLVICVVSAITFMLIRLAPGGPFDQEKAAPAEVIKQLEKQYNLDAPLIEQFGDYLGGILFEGDFGPSFKYPGRSVNDLIGAGFPITAELAFYALLFAIFFGILAGFTAALKHNSLMDYLPMTLAMTGISVPSLLLGPLLVLLFGLMLGWLPVYGWEGPEYKILPAITLGAVYAAYIARLSRSGMLETLAQDYIRTARAKGLAEWRIILRHAINGGILPVISFLGPAAAGMLAGSFVVETIFQIPGIGRFYVQAAFNRDYTMIMGTTIFLSGMIVIFNILSDVLQVLLNPRLSFNEESGGGR